MEFSKTIVVTRSIEIEVHPDLIADDLYLVYSRWSDRKTFQCRFMTSDMIKYRGSPQ